MMRILFIHNTISEYRIKFMQILAKNVDINFLITSPRLAYNIYGSYNEDKKTGMKIKELQSKTHIFDIVSTVRKSKYDIIVLPPVDDFYQFFCGILTILSKKKNSKIIYWSEGWQKGQLPLIKRCKKCVQGIMKRILFAHCDLFIASGSKAAYYYKNIGIEESKIRIAYDSSTSPTSNIINIRQIYNLPEDSQIVLFLGRIVARKGCDILIKAFDKLAQVFTNAYLLIGGDGKYRLACEDIASHCNYFDRIKFIGKVSPKDRATFYRESDVFVLPSYALGGTIEAWGLTVNESLEQGTPVVATDVVGAAYDLLDGECGMMVRENNIDELSNAISYFLIKMKEDKVKMNTICKEKYKKYSIDNMAISFINAFKDCYTK